MHTAALIQSAARGRAATANTPVTGSWQAALDEGRARQDELGLVLQWTAPQALRYYFELPEATPSVNVLRDMHFHTYRRARTVWSQRVAGALKRRGFALHRHPPLQQAALIVARHSAGQLDWDNALGGLKLLQDCLVQASARNPDGLGLVQDDSPRHMPYPPFMRQLKAARGQGRTEVWIFELPAG